jgi:hypothetical protein
MLGTIERRGAHPLLKVREAGTSSLKGHDLAVNDEIGDALMLKWLDQLWIRRVLVGAVRDNSAIRFPFRNARQRTPSSFRSKIQSGSENRSSVRIASIGLTQAGCDRLRSLRRASAGSAAKVSFTPRRGVRASS